MKCPKCEIPTSVCGCTWEDLAKYQREIKIRQGCTVCVHGTPTDEECLICLAEIELPK